VETKLQAELDSVLGGRAPVRDDLAKLTYTRMVIDETMHIYPAVPAIERESIEADILAGVDIPNTWWSPPREGHRRIRPGT
jgi:hypothetical protein